MDDREDMTALRDLRRACREYPSRAWQLLCFGNAYRCIIAGPEESRYDAATLRDAVYGAMRQAGLAN